ncbi:MBL fold metallo-hydrolase [Marinicella sediminis]|uniref:MBL fold metallo-hydrolase n=1 Tax=Marinicella sediminis TaxID=1792834 RepID=A0ABV7JDL4_9GAMM|nr:MBL fold metallo-hydrolase [Marinicella sediminis]
MSTYTLLILGLLGFTQQAFSTDQPEVTYLGNTALMISHQQTQVLFDPFFHQHFGQYQLVPEDIRGALMSGSEAYAGIEVILISHAHGDHFDAGDLLLYLTTFAETRLVAPVQAVHELQALDGYAAIAGQVHAIDLAYGDAPVSLTLGQVAVDVVRIPHAGWPGRAHVANLVYRVTLNEAVTVMHMGDADPDDLHFKPWAEHWEAKTTDQAFPPYWFMLTPDGRHILEQRIHAASAIGVHVPNNAPAALKQVGADFFHQPGNSQIIPTDHTKKEIP